MTNVTPNHRDKSDSNRCVIECFLGVLLYEFSDGGCVLGLGQIYSLFSSKQAEDLCELFLFYKIFKLYYIFYMTLLYKHLTSGE